MSWRVRHFLKRVRENKGDGCKKILPQSEDICTETDNSTTYNQSNTLFNSPKHNLVENNNSLIPPIEFHNLPPISTNLESRFSPFSSSKGRYINWTTRHSELAAQSWCCIGDIIYFCDKHECQTLRLSDPCVSNKIVSQVKALLTGSEAPFDIRKRFPGNIEKPEDLWICIGRCASVEYHLKRVLSLFRKPLAPLLIDKQRMLKQNFRLAVSGLRLDISAHISTVNLYDRNIFEHEFQLRWEDTAD